MSDKASKCCRHQHTSRALAYAALGGLALGVLGTHLLATFCHCKKACSKSAQGRCGGSSKYSLADQPARFAKDKAANNIRVLDIDSVFEPARLQGKAVLVTGANRGLGLALAQEAAASGALVFATCRRTSEELSAVPNCTIIENVDVTSDESMTVLTQALDGVTIDVLINNAGYFYGPVEKLDSLNFKEESAMIEICALGSLRVTAALWNAGCLASDGSAKIIMITSQGGSIAWRPVQNAPGPDFGGDYGHHMSKAASNMMGKLVSLELQGKALVGIFHPGFNRTEMTSKYSDIWDEEGAVDPSVGAKRVLHEVNLLTAETSGQFINCEDGKQIPW